MIAQRQTLDVHLRFAVIAATDTRSGELNPLLRNL